LPPIIANGKTGNLLLQDEAGSLALPNVASIDGYFGDICPLSQRGGLPYNPFPTRNYENPYGCNKEPTGRQAVFS